MQPIYATRPRLSRPAAVFAQLTFLEAVSSIELSTIGSNVRAEALDDLYQTLSIIGRCWMHREKLQNFVIWVSHTEKQKMTFHINGSVFQAIWGDRAYFSKVSSISLTLIKARIRSA